MKKYLFLMMTAIIMIGSTSTMNAQTTQAKRVRQHLTEDQIVTKRVNQMAQTLMLDDATLAKFTPIYSQYLKENMACRKMTAGQWGKDDCIKNDAETDKMIRQKFAQSRKMLDIRENYYDKFRKFLSPKQILKIYQTEKQNQNKMKKEMNKRKKGRH